MSIQNKSKYIELVNASKEVRRYINEVLHVKMKKFVRLFNYAFNKKDQEFVVLKDLVYYQGGYPSENSLAKAEVLVKKVALMANFLKLAGKEWVYEEHCKKYGIEFNIVKADVSIDAVSDSPMMLMKLWKEMYPDREFPEDQKEFLSFILDESCVLQAEICEKADSIKIDAASEAKKHCDMLKEGFINSVDVCVALDIQKEKHEKDLNSRSSIGDIKIDKTKVMSRTLDKSISIFKK